ncbi:hypothetical protein KFL_016480010, partial [Klebsormidium nitens]
MPDVVRPYLRVGQEFLVAGGFDDLELKDVARAVKRVGPAEFHDGPSEAYRGNHAEADTRVWLHARVSPYRVVTIYSPDTDITMVGLLNCRKWREGGSGETKQVYVQICRPDGKDTEAQFVSGTDGNTLADWPRHRVESVTGQVGAEGDRAEEGAGGESGLNCGIGRRSVGEGESERVTEGWAGVPREQRAALGAFLKLIGTSYFYKHKARFSSPSAARSFSSFSDADDTNLEAISKWLEHLREQTWAAVPNEEDCLPSFGALYFQYLRGLFALKMWEQACNGQIRVPAITAHGYCQTERGLELLYDYQRRIEQIKEQVATVLKGCGCRRQGRSIRPTFLEEEGAEDQFVILVQQEVVDREGQLRLSDGEEDDEEEVDEWQDWDEHLPEADSEELEEAALSWDVAQATTGTTLGRKVVLKWSKTATKAARFEGRHDQ